jgi:hypothetical protein
MRQQVSYRATAVYLSFHTIAFKRMHALKCLACRKRVAAVSSPAATCKQGAALTSPAQHACGCARPSRARFGLKCDFVRWIQHFGTLRYVDANLLRVAPCVGAPGAADVEQD